MGVRDIKTNKIGLLNFQVSQFSEESRVGGRGLDQCLDLLEVGMFAVSQELKHDTLTGGQECPGSSQTLQYNVYMYHCTDTLMSAYFFIHSWQSCT